jgi:hypothetical protein
MIVTTGTKPPEQHVGRARELAVELGGRYVPRSNKTLTSLRSMHGNDDLLVFASDGLRYYEGDEPVLYFHPSMAFVRVKRLRKGESDTLIDTSGCRPGDSVLDCTAGLASDAIVFSYAVGATGSVTALESQGVLHAIVKEGLRQYDTGLPDVNEALRRIEMQGGDHLSRLSVMADKSVDIVYFDPMFRKPLHASSALGPLRSVANDAPIEAEAVRQAIRVARKSVVMKEHKDSVEFGRLGFERRHLNTSKIAYGVIPIDQQ